MRLRSRKYPEQNSASDPAILQTVEGPGGHGIMLAIPEHSCLSQEYTGRVTRTPSSDVRCRKDGTDKAQEAEPLLEQHGSHSGKSVVVPPPADLYRSNHAGAAAAAAGPHRDDISHVRTSALAPMRNVD